MLALLTGIVNCTGECVCTCMFCLDAQIVRLMNSYAVPKVPCIDKSSCWHFVVCIFVVRILDPSKHNSFTLDLTLKLLLALSYCGTKFFVRRRKKDEEEEIVNKGGRSALCWMLATCFNLV